MKKLSYEHTLGIKVKDDANAKAIFYIKQETGLSLAEIKNKIQASDYIYESIVGDLDGLKKINRMKRKLAQHNATCYLFQDDIEKTSEFFDNIEERGIQTAEEEFRCW